MENRFILRTPLLRLSSLVETEEELLQAFGNPVVREALFIASRDLYKELLDMENGGVKDAAKRDKALVGLYKYYTRMCTRPTPFGLFAGLNTGRFDDRCSIELMDKAQPKLRLDMDYLCNLFYELNKDSTIYPYLNFYPNTTLYHVHGQWRYVEYQFKEDSTRYHNLVAIEDNELLSLLLVPGGCYTYDRLVESIISFGFDEQEAKQYIHDLVQGQVLVSDLYPSITGEEYQYRLFRRLENIPLDRFKGLNSGFGELAAEDIDLIIKIGNIERFLKDRFGLEVRSNHIIQVDLLKTVKDCTLPVSVKEIIGEVTGLLARLVLAPRQGSELLEKFKMAYYERYEDLFMPLAYIMDTDIGVGYKNAISIAHTAKSSGASQEERAIRAVKMRIYRESVQKGLRVVELRKEDIPGGAIPRDYAMPDVYSFIGNLFLTAEGGILVRYKSANGPSGTRLLGRFGHLDAEIEQLCSDLAAAEEKNHPNVLMAEIAHLPQGRMGNVITRPHYRKYEIPYLSHSLLPGDQQVTMDELFIGVVNSRVVLFSRRLNREIVPRMANAHNYSGDGLPIYHFLADLQYQKTMSAFYWTWDELYDEEFLPRVTYKNVILTPARWNLPAASFRKIPEGADTAKIAEILKGSGLPEQLIIPQGDNELYVDLRSGPGLKAFLKYCRNVERVVVEEFLYSSSNAVSGYAAEVVIPFVKEHTSEYPGVANIRTGSAEKRQFGPLSEWIYLKLYTGKKFSEKLLLEIVPALILELKGRKLIAKWFFIRYADPKDHLRLRFLADGLDKRETLLEIVDRYLREYLDSNMLWDIQLGTYNREMERYGWETVGECEEWFWHNSEMVLQLLPLLKQCAVREQQLFIAMFCVDGLLVDFGYDLAGKMELATRLASQFANEFDLSRNKLMRQRLNDDFREYHAALKRIFGMKETDTPYEAVAHLCRQHSEHSAAVIHLIRESHRDASHKTELIVASFVHMFINRLFSEGQRHKEMVIYYFLSKFYASELAREKASRKAESKEML